MGDVFDLGTDHGCLTGDCPHERTEECFGVIREYVAELVSAGKRCEAENAEWRLERECLHAEIERLKEKLEQKQITRYDELYRGWTRTIDAKSDEIKRLQAEVERLKRLNATYVRDNGQAQDQLQKDLATCQALCWGAEEWLDGNITNDALAEQVVVYRRAVLEEREISAARSKNKKSCPNPECNGGWLPDRLMTGKLKCPVCKYEWDMEERSDG